MEFFARLQDDGVTFETFGTTHLITLGIIAVVWIALILMKNKLNSNAKLNSIVRYTIAGCMIFQQASYYIWVISIGYYEWGEILPFHLCAITVFVGIYLLFSKDKRWYPFMYFMGLCGATQALLTPSMGGYSFPHFRFFQFFVGHGLIILCVIYLLVTDGVKVNFKECIKSFVILQIFGVIAVIVNSITGGNYLFLAHKPDSASIFDFLADWPYYIIQLELVAIAIIMLFSVPYIIKYKKDFFNLKKTNKE